MNQDLLDALSLIGEKEIVILRQGQRIAALERRTAELEAQNKEFLGLLEAQASELREANGLPAEPEADVNDHCHEVNFGYDLEQRTEDDAVQG